MNSTTPSAISLLPWCLCYVTKLRWADVVLDQRRGHHKPMYFSRMLVSHKEIWRRGNPWPPNTSQVFWNLKKKKNLNLKVIFFLHKIAKRISPAPNYSSWRLGRKVSKHLLCQNEHESKHPSAELCPNLCLSSFCWYCSPLYEMVPGTGCGSLCIWMGCNINSRAVRPWRSPLYASKVCCSL